MFQNATTNFVIDDEHILPSSKACATVQHEH
jgi:hypothetical protein